MLFLWQFAKAKARKHSLSRCNCCYDDSMCFYHWLDVPVSMVIPPLKRKCRHKRVVIYGVSNFSGSLIVIHHLLLQAGDVETNPGPETGDSKQQSCNPLDISLGECDEARIRDYLKSLKRMDIINVGVSLGIAYRKLSDMPADEVCLAMISMWLAKQDSTSENTGTPTLRLLVKVLRDNELNGCAEKIENENDSTIANDSCKKTEEPKINPKAAENCEEPLCSLEEGREKYRERKPLPPLKKATKEYEALIQFSKEVEFILQTVNDNEYYAATTFLKPPFEECKRAIAYPSAGSVVGMFADHKAALIQTDVGSRAGRYLQDAIKNFPSANFIIRIGVCSAFDKKYKLADVLVSRKICDLAWFRVDSDGSIVHCGETTKVDRTLEKLFCNDVEFGDYVVAKPTERAAKVYVGTFASCSILINNQEIKEKIEAAVPGVIGGEMEGVELLRFKEDNPNIGVIVIKGVVDYGDGHREEKWQFMAAMAALAYADAKLEWY